MVVPVMIIAHHVVCCPTRSHARITEFINIPQQVPSPKTPELSQLSPAMSREQWPESNGQRLCEALESFSNKINPPDKLKSATEESLQVKKSPVSKAQFKSRCRRQVLFLPTDHLQLHAFSSWSLSQAPSRQPLGAIN